MGVLKVLSWFGECVLALIGPLFVLIALGLTSSVVYVWARVLLPMHVEEWVSLEMVFHAFMAVFLVTNIFYNYIQCIRVAPGSPPPLQPGETPPPPRKEDKNGEGDPFCKKCNCVKPPRAHHCHVCKKCVLRMDHHCPWIHNCVGYYNHRYFVLFLAYMWLGCAYIALMAAEPFFSEDSWRKPWHYPLGRGSIVFVFVLTVSICLSMTFMMIWQLFLVLTAQTTIEFYFNRYRKRDAVDAGLGWKNEYDLGVAGNAKYFFGITHWWQLLMPLTNILPPDGIPPANAVV